VTTHEIGALALGRGRGKKGKFSVEKTVEDIPLATTPPVAAASAVLQRLLIPLYSTDACKG
jgi:hypothetical protein